MLLMQTNLWTAQVQQYLANVESQRDSCCASTNRPSNERVSLASLNKSFNDVVCVDQMQPRSVTLLHVMDVETLFSATSVVQSTAFEKAVVSFESVWLDLFWSQTSIHGDIPVRKEGFRKYVEMYGMTIRPVPPRQHKINPTEPRHGTTRSIFLRL